MLTKRLVNKLIFPNSEVENILKEYAGRDGLFFVITEKRPSGTVATIGLLLEADNPEFWLDGDLVIPNYITHIQVFKIIQ